ncbi:baculoviral IAP repeat-containing protein 7-like [Watersipora subatra]|uniref:baculoviral IAP repeat-containing protein 7-like n=1 Tax=Watersipora subatra TaxID=2589382 RepID=UPI00355C429E
MHSDLLFHRHRLDIKKMNGLIFVSMLFMCHPTTSAEMLPIMNKLKTYTMNSNFPNCHPSSFQENLLLFLLLIMLSGLCIAAVFLIRIRAKKEFHNYKLTTVKQLRPPSLGRKPGGCLMFNDEHIAKIRSLKDDNWIKKTCLWIYPVAQYPENHNPVIPLTLQKELDQKNPKEYLTYIKNDLTTEERESLMVDEGERRRTFQTRWPHDGTLSGAKMAEAGFYYLGERDQVQCVFCRGRLHNWSQQEVPMTEHARLFNFCRFVKGLNCGNREYRSKKMESENMTNITVFGNLTPTGERRWQESGTDSGPLGICTNRAAVIKYAPDSARLRTFQRWPASSPLTGEQICEAGFYYTGFGDQVRCFYCLGGIKGWTTHDKPWEEHARWFPDCSYMLNKKGTAYVDLIHQRTPDNKKCTTKTKLQKRVEWKKKAVISEQEAMPEICEKLGHDRQTIGKALANNNNHFESIKDMVNAVHALEDAGEEPIRQGEIPPTSVAASHPLQEHNPPAQQPANQQIGQLQQSERQTKHKAGCRLCELKTTNFVPATNVGLPCGHLIYCDSCKTDESKKSVIQHLKCPFSGCNSPLAGTIKVFFA